MLSPRYNQAAALEVAPEPEPQVSGGSQPQPESQEVQTQWTVEEIVPMIATVIIVAVLVALLVLYISEYARLTTHGYTQQKLREQLGQERRDIATRRAEVERLKRPERIVTAATDRGLVRLTQVQTMPVPAALLPARSSLAFQAGPTPAPKAGRWPPPARGPDPALAPALAAERQGR